MKTKTEIRLNTLLCQFNPFHNSKDRDGLNGALAVNSEKRQAFNDLLINILNNDDFRDNERFTNIVAFAEDFNNFLRGLDNFYRQEADSVKKASGR